MPRRQRLKTRLGPLLLWLVAASTGCASDGHSVSTTNDPASAPLALGHDWTGQARLRHCAGDDEECLIALCLICGSRECGDDGCGATCGECSSDRECDTQTGTCVSGCVPDCTDRDCGDDGCGGDCGECKAGLRCTDSGQCMCVRSCWERECGEDGCGGSCGTCKDGNLCSVYGQCLCAPDCSDKICGSDGCGGSCGRCADGSTCSDDGQRCIPGCDEEPCDKGCHRADPCDSAETCAKDDCTKGHCGERAGESCSEGKTCNHDAEDEQSVDASAE